MATDWDKPFVLGNADRKKVYDKGGKVNVLFDVEGEEIWVPEKCIHEDSDVWWNSKDPSGALIVRLWWAKKTGYS
jgi:hypothetical protein